MYKELKNIFDKCRLDMRAMVLTYIIDKGCSNIEKLTDEDIASFEGNGLMTQGFVQELARTARDVCKAVDNPSELYQFCNAEDIFDTWYYANIPTRNMLSSVAYNGITAMRYQDYRNGNNDEEICDYLGIDIEELEAIERV